MYDVNNVLKYKKAFKKLWADIYRVMKQILINESRVYINRAKGLVLCLCSGDTKTFCRHKTRLFSNRREEAPTQKTNDAKFCVSLKERETRDSDQEKKTKDSDQERETRDSDPER